jgi:hypothetical protein
MVGTNGMNFEQSLITIYEMLQELLGKSIKTCRYINIICFKA